MKLRKKRGGEGGGVGGEDGEEGGEWEGREEEGVAAAMVTIMTMITHKP